MQNMVFFSKFCKPPKIFHNNSSTAKSNIHEMKFLFHLFFKSVKIYDIQKIYIMLTVHHVMILGK